LGHNVDRWVVVFGKVTSSGRVDLGLTVHFPVGAFLAVVLLAQALTRKATT
jgi:hypothetical protein